MFSACLVCSVELRGLLWFFICGFGWVAVSILAEEFGRNEIRITQSRGILFLGIEVIHWFTCLKFSSTAQTYAVSLAVVLTGLFLLPFSSNDFTICICLPSSVHIEV